MNSINNKVFIKMLSVYLIVNTMNLTVAFIIKNPVIQRYRVYVFGLIFIVFFLKNLRFVPNTTPTVVISELLLGVLLLCGKVLNHLSLSVVFERVVWTIIFGLPLFSLARHTKVSETDNIIRELKIPSCVALCAGVVVFIMNYLLSNDYSYNMSLGYFLLLPAMYFYQGIAENRGNILFFSITCIIIFLCGSRGPLLCVAVFILYKLLFSSLNAKKPNEIIACLLFLLFILACIFFRDQFLEFLNKAIRHFGLKSRTLQMLSSGEIIYDSGRSSIQNFAWAMAKERPFFGWGLVGELSFMKGYPHQFFIEICVDFGCWAGIFISAVFLTKVLKRLLASRFRDSFMVLLICSGFIPLFFSGSYLSSPLFWVVAGYMGSKKYNYFNAREHIS